MINISVSGNFKFPNLQQMHDDIDQALSVGAGLIQKEARDTCPVDTGNLQSHIDIENDGDLSYSIGTNVEYARHVEFGTIKKGARPFLFPALNDNKDQIVNGISKAIKDNS